MTDNFMKHKEHIYKFVFGNKQTVNKVAILIKTLRHNVIKISLSVVNITLNIKKCSYQI